MTKKYIAVPNPTRKEFIRLVHTEGKSITEAARTVKIGYPIAKVINNVYKKEGRTEKKITRVRR